MDNNNGSYACNGLAFFIASSNYTAPSFNASDGHLGLVDRDHMFNSKGINPFVAVEFDTYYNSDWDHLEGYQPCWY
ncbi:2-acetamido-2-deoxy-D-galactose-binding seed lectin 2 [Linum grandiflorum]